jgi:glucose-6-phosphate isomerase
MKTKINDVVLGKIISIKPYGLFVKLENGEVGLLHISEISTHYLQKVDNLFYVNEKIIVKVLDVDEENKRLHFTLQNIDSAKFYKAEGHSNDSKNLLEKIKFWINDYEQGGHFMKLNLDYMQNKPDFAKYAKLVKDINNTINEKTGAGSDFLGWTTWPEDYDKKEVERMKKKAEFIRKNFDVLLVCGIGGSYLGARAAIEALNGLHNDNKPEIIYVGNTFSSDYIAEIVKHLENKSFAINVISKSGTTTETSVSFRLFKEMLEQRIGKEKAKDAIIATTDKERGALKELCNIEGYETYVLPDDIGGRYSVLTAVGLFPIACAGINIDQILNGAKRAMVELNNDDLYTNMAYQYAVCRDYMYRNGKSVEMFVSYEPRLVQLNEWLKQLFGESEGKEGKGLLPDSAHFTTDLHSLGQFIQEGTHCLFETVLYVKNSNNVVKVPHDEADLDGLNYLEGKTLDEINYKAFMGTLDAHSNTGKVNNIVIEIDKMDAFTLGYLFYFFMRVCAMSAYLLGINPFNQPGVEVYKKNMFHLLGKKGY